MTTLSMRTLRTLTLTAAGLLAPATSALAGWDNVFQVACRDCAPRRSNYAPVQAPSTSRYETRYEENCREEVVTVNKPTLVGEQVPVQVRSYYNDPVTTYTTRSYRNPQTGCTEQISVPRTCYVRREECNTVMRYIERMQMVPTQVTRKVCEKTPITTIVGPTTRSYSYDCDNCKLPPNTSARPAQPQVEMIPGRPPVTTPEEALPRIPAPAQAMPTIPLSGSRPKPTTSFSGKVDARTTSYSAATLHGEVTLADRLTPRPGAKVVFLSATDLTHRVNAVADGFGNFEAALPAGEWFVYLGEGSGRAAYQRTVRVGADGATLLLASK